MPRQSQRDPSRLHPVKIRDKPLASRSVYNHPFHLVRSSTPDNVGGAKVIENSDRLRVDVLRTGFVSRKPRFIENQNIVTSHCQQRRHRATRWSSANDNDLSIW